MSKLTHAGAVVVREINGNPEYLLVSASGAPAERVIPKGHIKLNEAPEAAALRELREEAGIEGEILAPLGTHEFTVANERVHAGYFLVRYLRTVTAEEERRLFWYDYDDAKKYITHADARHLIEAAQAEWQRRADHGR